MHDAPSASLVAQVPALQYCSGRTLGLLRFAATVVSVLCRVSWPRCQYGRRFIALRWFGVCFVCTRARGAHRRSRRFCSLIETREAFGGSGISIRAGRHGLFLSLRFSLANCDLHCSSACLDATCRSRRHAGAVVLGWVRERNVRSRVGAPKRRALRMAVSRHRGSNDARDGNALGPVSYGTSGCGVVGLADGTHSRDPG